MIYIKTGQFAINADGKKYVFTPSFAAMAKLGSGAELVDMFGIIHGAHYPRIRPTDPDLRKRILTRCYAEVMQTSIKVLKACSESDIGDILGYYEYTLTGKFKCKPGVVPMDDVITLAQHCLLHGLIGVAPEQKEPEPDQNAGEYKTDFDVMGYVYSAVAHLGLSEAEAWNMTMTGYRAAVRAKTPSEATNSSKPSVSMDKNKYDDVMAMALKTLSKIK